MGAPRESVTSEMGRLEKGAGAAPAAFLRWKEFCENLELLEFPPSVKGVHSEKDGKPTNQPTQEAQLRSEEPRTLYTSGERP